MACTTILVGKNASYDGSTLVARNHDSNSGEFMPQKFVVVKPEEQPRTYRSFISKVEIDLPDNPMRYTAVPNAIDDVGIWAGCGINEKNIAMTATETITSNERVQGADPLVENGIGEEDITTLVLPYINSAREGVLRLGELLEKYGTYEMNGIAFQDIDEIWWLETIGGHHWIARRVPDNAYVVMPNQQGIDEFDLDDAFGEKKEHLCSVDLREFIANNHLDLSIKRELTDNELDYLHKKDKKKMNELFNARFAFGSDADSDHTYNTPRAWVIQRYLNRDGELWEGHAFATKPSDNDLEWAREPDRKITIEDIKYLLSNHYQGTEYDPYGKYGDDSKRGMYRPIGINRNNFLGITQIRPYMPKEIRSLQWLTFGSNIFNAIVPFYININTTPDYMANTTAKISTDSYYWHNRLIAALADAHFSDCSSHIERYQNSVQSKAHYIINKFDAEFESNKITNDRLVSFSEKANAEMTAMLETETIDLLDKVLYTASCNMKNGFNRSDA